MDSINLHETQIALDGLEPAPDARSTAVDCSDPVLPHELIETILLATAHWLCCEKQHAPPPGILHTQGLRKPIRGDRPAAASSFRNLPAALTSLVLTALDLDPVARYVLPKLPHVWPPPVAAGRGHVAALEHARRLGLFMRWLHTESPGGLAMVVRAANQRGHAHVLRWIQGHWHEEWQAWAISADGSSMVEDTVVQKAVAWDGARAADMLDFWMEESGADMHAILTSAKARESLANAFVARNGGVVRWWATHTAWLGPTAEQAKRWSWSWVEQALRDGAYQVVDACAEAQATNLVEFVVSPAATAAFPAAERTVAVVDIVERITDMASQAGQVDLVKQWARRQHARGLPVHYTNLALDLCASVPVLDWWAASKSPLLYTHQALHQATARRAIEVLDWWLAAYRSGTINELKYNAWIMTVASCDCQFDARNDEQLISAQAPCMAKSSSPSTPDSGSASTLRVLQWWDDSGLDLKLPDPHDAIPSPIDLCMDTHVLDWWLNRAKRLQAASPTTTTIQDHFPHYTQTAMHRSAYWNQTNVLTWWLTVAQPAGLEPRFRPHRLVELAAMVPLMQTPEFRLASSSLAWCLKNVPEIQFRGQLLEWVSTGAADATSGVPMIRRGRQTAVANVKRICGDQLTLHDGGLLPPAGGYVRQEVGEEWVFLPMKRGSFTKG